MSEIPSWLKVEDEGSIGDSVPTIDGVPFWEWPNMPQDWREQHQLKPVNVYYERPEPRRIEPMPFRRPGRPRGRKMTQKTTVEA